MARAFDWQSKGHEFDSHILHRRVLDKTLFSYIVFLTSYRNRAISDGFRDGYNSNFLIDPKLKKDNNSGIAFLYKAYPLERLKGVNMERN